MCIGLDTIPALDGWTDRRTEMANKIAQ